MKLVNIKITLNSLITAKIQFINELNIVENLNCQTSIVRF